MKIITALGFVFWVVGFRPMFGQLPPPRTCGDYDAAQQSAKTHLKTAQHWDSCRHDTCRTRDFWAMHQALWELYSLTQFDCYRHTATALQTLDQMQTICRDWEHRDRAQHHRADIHAWRGLIHEARWDYLHFNSPDTAARRLEVLQSVHHLREAIRLNTKVLKAYQVMGSFTNDADATLDAYQGECCMEYNLVDYPEYYTVLEKALCASCAQGLERFESGVGMHPEGIFFNLNAYYHEQPAKLARVRMIWAACQTQPAAAQTQWRIWMQQLFEFQTSTN